MSTPTTGWRRRRWSTLLAALPLLARAGGPEAAAPAAFAFNGFGTLGVAHSSEPNADFVFDNLQPHGAGRSRDWSGDTDTRLGVQLTAHATAQLSAVVQVISEYRADGTYRPFVNWANVKYAFTPNLSVRVGRIGLASFLASDSRRVGFSNITARPPTEVYRLLAVKDSDGVDATYRWHDGDVSNTTSITYGRKTVTNVAGVDVHSTHLAGLFDTLENGALTLHAAYQVRDVDNQHPALGRFMSAGASYDPGPWFAQAEWAKAINYTAVGVRVVRAAWYVNGGVRIDTVAPYVTVAALRPLTDTGLAPLAQRSYAAGLRWDVARNVDLKLQWDQILLGRDSFGTLQNIAPGARPGGRLHVVSLLADLIF